MSVLLEHPHLLDIILGRTAAYIALALLLGIWLWEWRWQRQLMHSNHYRAIAAISGSLGVLIVISNIALESSAPFDANNMALPGLSDIASVLQTSFGIAWMVYGVSLLIAVASSRQYLRFAGIMGMVTAMVLTSHAGEDGIYQLVFWIDALHLASAMLWFGGLSLLLAFRLTGTEYTSRQDLQFFSWLALPVFICVLGSGAIRITLQYLETRTLASAYILMLMVKLLLISGVVILAGWLRHQLHHGSMHNTTYDQGITLEYFFALLLVLATTTLTQLSPY
ncbi:putative copper resistance protein D [Methylobacillus rhizosphaerae]|uniref:Putative copper resistance protein D n=1 Tax=Methylobacillus rhizosphaerae TaxID=551994 RepID=A0A238ZTT4_9PROT|nr:hypothetical protein [Methylobacillus rhizosphaerae]SNR86073.1 putative copper resistance protein D [Methylobacillus rhizosphaerae]